MKRTALVIAAAIIAVLIFWNRRGVRESGPGEPPAASSPIANSSPNAPPPPVDASDLAAELNSPARDIRADLQLVSTIIDTFRTNFLREGNPTGTNAEITAALAGENRHHLILIPRHHPAINADGELCDRWGTPFFFHAESGTKMDIRSAGPDRQHHTPDDVVWSP